MRHRLALSLLNAGVIFDKSNGLEVDTPVAAGVRRPRASLESKGMAGDRTVQFTSY
jgi:hypothetical protein